MKQCQDYLCVCMVCKRDIATAAGELSREQTQCERVKVELQKKFEDALSTSAQMDEKVEKRRQIYTETSQVHHSNTS